MAKFLVFSDLSRYIELIERGIFIFIDYKIVGRTETFNPGLLSEMRFFGLSKLFVKLSFKIC